MEQLVQLAKSHTYDFVTVSGDQAYDLADFDGRKGDEYMNFAQQLYSTVPYLGVTGNHEGAYNFSHYKNRWVPPSRNSSKETKVTFFLGVEDRFNIVPYQASKSSDALFYSFNYKSLHLISFSTEVYLKQGSNDQIKYALNWLEEDLHQANRERHLRPWIILITHHPIYCSVEGKDCTTQASLIRDGPTDAQGKQWGGLEAVLLKHKVDLYLGMSEKKRFAWMGVFNPPPPSFLFIAGHVHNYERTYPIANSTLQATSYHNPPSFFQVINGNAGQPEGPSPFIAGDPHAPWSAKRYASYGFSEVKVSPTALELTHHAINLDGSLGNVVDHVKVTKTAHHQ